MSTSTTLETAKRIGVLIAESPMDQRLKDSLLSQLELMSEDAWERLAQTLEAEKEFLSQLDQKLADYADWQSELWKKLELAQGRMIDDLVHDEIKDLERQSDIDEHLAER